MNRHFIHLTSTASTNTDLKSRIAAAKGPVYDVISADRQTGGRGRLGRTFFSPPGGLYVSVALPLTGEETDLPCLTLLAGLCVCTALEDLCDVAPRIKWPNDLYLNGKKLCGILCELVGGEPSRKNWTAPSMRTAPLRTKPRSPVSSVRSGTALISTAEPWAGPSTAKRSPARSKASPTTAQPFCNCPTERQGRWFSERSRSGNKSK